VRQFSIAHIAALATLVVGATIAVLLPRRHPGRPVQYARLVLAAVILAGWAGEYIAELIEGSWTVQYSLPLQLTDAVSLCAIAALLTERQLLIELVYFWAFSASLQAVLTPDLGSTFPSVFYPGRHTSLLARCSRSRSSHFWLRSRELCSGTTASPASDEARPSDGSYVVTQPNKERPCASRTTA